MRKTISAVLAALATIGYAGGALAEETTVVVPYSDLDMSSPEGNATLERRINAAVAAVCGEADIRNIRSSNAVAQCKIDTRAKAMEQLAPSPVAFANPYEGLELASIF